jgi:hypothetical protein
LSCIDDSFTLLGLCAALRQARMAQANCMPPRPSISDRLVNARPRKYRRPCSYAALEPIENANCPPSVRELWPKSGEEEQKICAKWLINYGQLWNWLHMFGHNFPS